MEEEVLLNLRQTRKAFIIEYGCALLIAVLLFLIYLTKNPIMMIYYIGFVLIALCIASAELHRAMTKYTMMESKLVIMHGIFKQTKKTVYFHPLGFATHLNVKQTRLQRLLKYGTIYLKEGTEGFQIKDVNNPHKVLDKIEERVEANKHPHKKKK